MFQKLEIVFSNTICNVMPPLSIVVKPQDGGPTPHLLRHSHLMPPSHNHVSFYLRLIIYSVYPHYTYIKSETWKFLVKVRAVVCIEGGIKPLLNTLIKFVCSPFPVESE